MRRISTLVLALWYSLLATQAAAAIEQLPRTPTSFSCDGRAYRVLSALLDPPDKIPV